MSIFKQFKKALKSAVKAVTKVIDRAVEFVEKVEHNIVTAIAEPVKMVVRAADHVLKEIAPAVEKAIKPVIEVAKSAIDVVATAVLKPFTAPIDEVAAAAKSVSATLKVATGGLPALERVVYDAAVAGASKEIGRVAGELAGSIVPPVAKVFAPTIAKLPLVEASASKLVADAKTQATTAATNAVEKVVKEQAANVATQLGLPRSVLPSAADPVSVAANLTIGKLDPLVGDVKHAVLAVARGTFGPFLAGMAAEKVANALVISPVRGVLDGVLAPAGTKLAEAMIGVKGLAPEVGQALTVVQQGLVADMTAIVPRVNLDAAPRFASAVSSGVAGWVGPAVDHHGPVVALPDLKLGTDH